MNKTRKHQRYKNELKLEAVRRVLENDEAVQEVVDDLNIRHRDNVYEWIKKYKKYGEAGFGRPLGRPKKGKASPSTDQEISKLKVEVDALKKYLEILVQKE